MSRGPIRTKVVSLSLDIDVDNYLDQNYKEKKFKSKSKFVNDTLKKQFNLGETNVRKRSSTNTSGSSSIFWKS